MHYPMVNLLQNSVDYNICLGALSSKDDKLVLAMDDQHRETVVDADGLKSVTEDNAAKKLMAEKDGAAVEIRENPLYKGNI